MADNLQYVAAERGVENYPPPTCYNHDEPGEMNCIVYGMLYDWKTALSACPSGWHLPSDAEWTQLTDFLDGHDTAGGKLKSTISLWKTPNIGATNESGFSGLPGGYSFFFDYWNSWLFAYVGESTTWWTSTEFSLDSTHAWSRGLRYDTVIVYENAHDKQKTAYSVRCLMDSIAPEYPDHFEEVTIGNQVWMKRNIDVNIGNNWCYNNDVTNCEIYGRLYKWRTALTACPQGWHLPSREEFRDLVDHLGGEQVAGGKLKSTGTIEDGTGRWARPNAGATDESGFSGLPGGMRYSEGKFNNSRGYSADWWSSDASGSDANTLSLAYQAESAYAWWSYVGQQAALSVRCIRD